MNNKGFTLIELLVVVLIIGILAAVAVPQYQKAVDKATMSNILTNFATIRQAVVMYRMTNGNWPVSMDDLDIEINDAKWSYSLMVGNFATEACNWSNPGLPRGFATIRAVQKKAPYGGGIFYAIPERAKYVSGIPSGVFCCLWTSSTNGYALMNRLCNNNRTTGKAGRCYTGSGPIPIREETTVAN